MSDITPAQLSSVDFPTLLAEFDTSGQSAAAFARSRGLARWRLYHALDRRKARAARAAGGENVVGPKLVPVRVVPEVVAAPPGSRLEIELAGGHRLHITADFDAALLRRILGALS